MLELADIFVRHGAEYLVKFGDAMLPSHKRALYDICACRTAALGGHLMACSQNCGHMEYAYHSCKNRGCPKCHGKESRQWVEKRKNELLPFVTYFHLVFTLPSELREIVRKQQKKLYSILMQSAAESVQTLAADHKYVGGKLGMLAVLHTWTNAQLYHPHAHFLVPGGGVTNDGAWRKSRRKFLVPVKALSLIFRAKFLEKMQDEFPCLVIPREVWRKDWVVYCKPAQQGSEKVVEYLGRYVHRIAITNNRLLALKNGEVTFRYKQTRRNKKQWISSWKTMTLPALAFMARFLQHMPPKGFHKVRYYGLLSPVCREQLRQVQVLLISSQSGQKIDTCSKEKENQQRVCQLCKQGHMRPIKVLPRAIGSLTALLARSPP